jgi:hypothetical protein
MKAKLPKKAALMSMPICSSPNERLHIDLYGPLKTSAAGNHYLVVMTDAFTKYVELAAIPNKTENQVAKVLFERWFCRFSAPTVMVSDQGREFGNELVNRYDVLEENLVAGNQELEDDMDFFTTSERKERTFGEWIAGVLGLWNVVQIHEVKKMVEGTKKGLMIEVHHVDAIRDYAEATRDDLGRLDEEDLAADKLSLEQNGADQQQGGGRQCPQTDHGNQ